MLVLPGNLTAKKNFKRIAILTSGGDAPGMNAAIRAIVRYGVDQKIRVFGVRRGYSGLIEGDLIPLTPSSVANILQRGGTILKSDRCLEFKRKTIRRRAYRHLKENQIDALIVIGGDGSFRGGHLLGSENRFPVMGVPATIDNDIYGTEETIGFDTAVNTVVESIDKIRDTANSHNRLFIVEVMGHSTGFIAAHVGISSGAETILVPETNTTLGAICKTIDRGIARGKSSSIIVVAEGKKPGKANALAAQLEKRKYPTRVCILGHTQRGGCPTAHDRYLASTLGAAAVASLQHGHRGKMVGVRDNQLVLTSLQSTYGKSNRLRPEVLRLAKILSS